MGSSKELFKLFDLIQCGDVSSVERFLSHTQVDLNEVLLCKGIGVLHLAVGIEPIEKSKECTELLLKQRADPNLCNEDGLTPVHIAAIWGRVDNLKLLIGCGGDPYRRDLEGLSALDYTAREQQWDAFDYFHNVVEEKDDSFHSPCAFSLDLEKVLVTTDEMVAEYEPISDQQINNSTRKSEMVREWCDKNTLVMNKLYPTILTDTFTIDDNLDWRSINLTKNITLDLSTDITSTSFNFDKTHNTFKTCQTKVTPIEISGIQPLELTADESNKSQNDVKLRFSIYENFSLPGSPNSITHRNYNTKSSLRKKETIYIDSSHSLFTEDCSQDLDKALIVAQNKTNEWLSSSSRSESRISSNCHKTCSFNNGDCRRHSHCKGDHIDSKANKFTSNCHWCSSTDCKNKCKMNHSSCKVDHSKCNMDQSNCKIDHSNCKIYNSNCNTNNGNCKMEHGKCKMDHSKCKTDHNNCIMDCSNCKTKCRNWKMDHNNCKVEHRNCRMDHSNCKMEHTVCKMDYSHSKSDHSCCKMKQDHGFSQTNLNNCQTIESDCKETDIGFCNTRRSSASSGVSSNLSGGSIVIANVQEEYKYEDKEEGVVLIEKRLLVSPVVLPIEDDSPDHTIVSIASSLPPSVEYDNNTLRAELLKLGFSPGPIQNTTRTLYLKKLQALKKNPVVTTNNEGKTYSVVLAKSLRSDDWMHDLTPYMELETRARNGFANPNRKWREGMTKTSFTYLLLDPRFTDNLPARANKQSMHQTWNTFIGSIFYVGKGKRSRPYSHLYQALTLWKRNFTTSPDKKVQRILDVWSSGLGVICLHVFLNVIPAEAYTYEASMIDVIGVNNLTNQKVGNYYGIVESWPLKERRMLGLYLLYRAMQIFLSEGERHLRPDDID